MAIRKNKKFIDPRYFMDEKTEIIKEELSKTLSEISAADAESILAPAEPQDNLPRDKMKVAHQINRWFNARAQGNTGFRGTNLSDYLRKGAAGEELRHSGLPAGAIINFRLTHLKIAPENVKEFKALFMKLAKGIERDPSLLDSKKLGKKGDWYAVAKSL